MDVNTPKSEVPAAPVQDVAGKKSMEILIAEDNLVNQKVITRLLKKLEYTELCVVPNGAKCVAMCEEMEPDLILMDIHMPEMDGIEATRRIRALSATFPNLPFWRSQPVPIQKTAGCVMRQV